jgi:hypothetical protein
MGPDAPGDLRANVGIDLAMAKNTSTSTRAIT